MLAPKKNVVNQENKTNIEKEGENLERKQTLNWEMEKRVDLEVRGQEGMVRQESKWVCEEQGGA